jgi:hypothetical protein
MDGRSNNKGTIGNKGGRKGKAEEQKLIEHLTPMNELALYALKEGLQNKEQWAVKLFFEYYYSKPQKRLDITSNEETINLPLITFIDTESN